ncbi:polysaccharide biosynthesis tyrosine autokinase [Chryseobacterium daecheongense]|uniref:GumC family protein n=1 Tax=Chryseobacterium daecheongense TaxID=192389 RepID=UPI001FD6719F|nr:tyrosine-protein kinase [Chryseobacterium daecheongense]UOU96719.1 polysaccharide biosynthesis tyrosine autokinase [Chryseobacterium daecheongense]
MDKKYNKEFDLKGLVAPYFYKWKYFASIILLALLLAIYYIKSTTPVYKIQTSVLIKDAKKMSSASGDFGVLQSLGALSNMGTNSIENELEIFKSRAIVEDVLKQYSFQVSLFAEQAYYDKEIYGKENPYIFNIVNEKYEEEPFKGRVYIQTKGNEIILSSEDWKNNIKGYFNQIISLPFANVIITKNSKFQPAPKTKMEKVYIVFNNFEKTVIAFQEALKVNLLDKDATVIGLSIDYPNKEKGKDFLNSLVRQYNIYAINDKSIESRKTKEFIDERIVLISKELGDVETEKQKFKSYNNIVDLGTEARMNLQLKAQTRSRVLDIDTQMELNKMLQNFLNRKDIGDVLPLNIGLDNEAAAKNIQEYNLLVIKRNKLLENATENNPLVKEVDKQLNDLKGALSEALQKNQNSLLLARNQVASEMENSEEKISQIPFQEKLFRNIERQQQIKENLYLLLLQKREEAAIAMAITAEKARVLDKAYIDKNKVAPKKVYALALALVGGFLLAFSIIYLKFLFNDKVSNRKDIDKLSARPVLSEIPHVVNKKSEIVKLNDITPIAEAFRILATNLKFMLPKNNNNTPVIMVTSSVKGEGKTFISVNFALVLASSLRKVIVIGSDIRNPQLQRYHPEMKSVKGLTEYLYGEVTEAENIIHNSGFNDNCDFIYSGSIPPNPVDLLQSSRYADLLKYLKTKYDYIVLDTAPLLLVTDSFLIAENADATLYVVRSEMSKKDFIHFANNNIESNSIKNVAFVLNDVHKNNLGYSNQYGYGYHNNEKKWWQFFKK